MSKYNLTIATITHEGIGDANLQLSALDFLKDRGYRVCVSDGGSSRLFIERLIRMGHEVESTYDGLVSQHIQCLTMASKKADNILYTEPDKLDWFRKGLNKSIRQYFNRNLEFALISRNPRQMKTFPIDQQTTEEIANSFLSKWFLQLKSMDFVYGPRIFVSSLARDLIKESLSNLSGWSIPYYLLGKAYKKRLNISGLFNGVACPRSQRREYDPLYRADQLLDVIDGFLIGAI